ncbi:MAG TPA: hypothetical protein VGC65_07730 [Bacteroidia bacterium]|jgi:hypothetical protein
MKLFFAVAIASVYGLSTRLLFGVLDNFLSIMSITFLGLIPFVIGFLTIMLIPKEKKVGAAAAFFIPWLSSLAILFITIALSVEGTICWIMIYPFFSVFAGIGGIIAMYIRDRKKNKNFEKPTTLNVSLVFLVPAFLGFLEGDRTLTTKQFMISKEIIIKAAPAKVWKELVNINDIKEEEKTKSFSHALGFPQHISTTIDTLAVGGKRIAFYEKGLFFEETISQYKAEQLMVLAIKTDPSKIPADVMDEHILLGGKHVDISEDSYKLEALPDGSSKLTLSSRFFINTPFNWYAGIWADYLMADILQSELNLISKRATE